jgi:glycosyltransferase involved in cell wall biosynthesis
MKIKKMKIALVHDWLNGMRGGEKVLEQIVDIFPQADIFTLFLEKDKISDKIKKQRIFTSGLNKNSFIKKNYKYFLPLFPKHAEMFDLRDYDLVISSSHCVAKGVIPQPDATHISYIHSPMRYVWDQHYDYFPRTGGLKNRFIKNQCHKLRTWDAVSSSRVDFFIANSSFVKERIKKYYRRDAVVIPPPVDTEFFVPVKNKQRSTKYFLTVCALVPYKRVDLTVQAFNQCSEELIVVGRGSEEKRLKKMAKSNIHFKKNLPLPELLDLYQQAEAFVFSGVEDFGISFVEAQACGIPIIAFNKGGVKDIVNLKTGILFDDQNIETMLKIITGFKRNEFDENEVWQNSQRFSEKSFKRSLYEFVLGKLND